MTDIINEHINSESAPDNRHNNFDFSVSYDAALPELLSYLNISLILTSYQADRLITVRSHHNELDTHFIACPRPMGLTVDQQRLTLGIWAQVLDFRRDDSICDKVDDSGKVDACYLPRASHVSGMINIHDIAWGDEGLWAVNSTFSCLCTLDSNYSFVPRWQPSWITELQPEDRCHLNGMAMRDNKPRYVTTFNQENSAKAWRKNREGRGTLIDIETDVVLADGLMMPHSPRYYRDRLYVCESGYGLIWTVDPQTGEKTLFAKLQGFTRGMAFYDNLMFVGLSRVRASEASLSPPLAQEFAETYSGIWVLDINTAEVVTYLCFEGDIKQVYDIGIIPDAVFPQVLEWQDEKIEHFFHFPDQPASDKHSVTRESA